MHLLDASLAVSQVEGKFTAVVLNVGLTQVHKPPVVLLAPCAAAPLSGTTAFSSQNHKVERAKSVSVARKR